MSYRTIVVGTDGSPTANIAQRQAAALARGLGAKLVLVTAFDPPRITRQMAETFLEYAEANAQRDGVEVSTEIVALEPAEALIITAERLDADLVVVGNKGMGAPSRFRLGSVAAKVAHASPCDLLIVDTVRAAERGERGGATYQHMLVATDGSPTAGEAAHTAFEIAMQLHTPTVTLVCVGDPLVGAVKLEQAAAAAPEALRIDRRTAEGDPAERIVELAEQETVDLIVIGNRGLTGVRRWVLGSVSNNVAHYAPADVLIVRTSERDVSDIEAGRGSVIDTDGRKLAIFRDADGVTHTLSARCTHMGCTVGWNDADKTWDCPCHGSRFHADGSVLQGPAAKPLEPVGEAPAAAAAASTAPQREPEAEPAAPVKRSTERFVIVGASMTGATAASTLREEGFDGEVILVGAEPAFPYERPPLSKEFLRGEAPIEKALVRAPGYWTDKEVELRLGTTVTRVDTEGRRLEVAGGEPIPFDKLLIATGARNRRFPIPGLDLPGVHGLRTAEDAARIRAEIVPGRRAVVVGAGFIGSEVAASLRVRGLEVTVVDGGAVPLERVLGPEIGAVLEAVHREHEVRFVFNDRVQSFEGNGRVEAVVTAEGQRLECDFAVVGVGVEPVTELAEGSGIEVDNGILVDASLGTNVEGVFAAGDVANHLHPVFGQRMRTEHWQNAMKQGRAAALAMMGKGEPYTDTHWFWSDQYDQNLQYAGHHTGWDELVVRGGLESRKFVAFFVQGGVVQAAVAMNSGRDLRRAIPLIARRQPVDPAVLRDPQSDLSAV